MTGGHGRGRDFCHLHEFSPALRSAEPPIQWIIGEFPGGKSI